MQVPGVRGGREPVLVHPVDGDPASQGPDHTQAAVMHDVRVELQYDRRRAYVYRIVPVGNPRADRGCLAPSARSP